MVTACVSLSSAGGGFGGLIQPITADTVRRSPRDRGKLAVLVRQAGLFDAPEAASSEEPGRPVHRGGDGA